MVTLINQIYLNDAVLKELKSQFRKNKVLKLDSFLVEEDYLAMKKSLGSSKMIHNKVPDTFSFSSVLRVKDLVSWEFLDFLESVIGTVTTVEIKTFSHRDYTLLHDDVKRVKEKKAYFFLCDSWDELYGGNIVFVRERNDNFYIAPFGNSLVFVDKEKSTKEFVQYVNHRARKKSFMVVEFCF